MMNSFFDCTNVRSKDEHSRKRNEFMKPYTSSQRARGGRSDNPTAQQFGYNDLTIATQRYIAPVIRGNVGGR